MTDLLTGIRADRVARYTEPVALGYLAALTEMVAKGLLDVGEAVTAIAGQPEVPDVTITQLMDAAADLAVAYTLTDNPDAVMDHIGHPVNATSVPDLARSYAEDALNSATAQIRGWFK